MCLCVNKDIHKGLKPLIAKTDLLVYKCLDHNKYDVTKGKRVKNICTPFQYMPINFTEGKCTLGSELDERHLYIDRGIHSFFEEGEANRIVETFVEEGERKHWSIT